MGIHCACFIMLVMFVRCNLGFVSGLVYMSYEWAFVVCFFIVLLLDTSRSLSLTLIIDP